MPLIDIKVYYLEMLAPNGRAVPPPREGLSVVQAKKPTVSYYRFLYNAVGKDYHWLHRGKLSDAELTEILHGPQDDLYVLHVEGTPAGFAELVRHRLDDIELVQFGLLPEFIGQGLGKYFLQWTIDKAWSHSPKRYWLHTCTLDHPKALPNYQEAGFVIYKEEMKQRQM